MVPGSNELHQAVCRQARAGGRPLHSSALLCRAAREVEVRCFGLARLQGDVTAWILVVQHLISSLPVCSPQRRAPGAGTLRRQHSVLHHAAAARLSLPPQVSHILLAPGSAQLAAELKQRIEGGEPLADLAKEHSKCPSRRCGMRVGAAGEGLVLPQVRCARGCSGGRYPAQL